MDPIVSMQLLEDEAPDAHAGEVIVPYLTEDEMVKRGAVYKKAAEPWAPFAVSDQRVITGQNPASGAPVAELVLKALAG